MSGAEILKTISETLCSDARAKNVFGDPVTSGDRTVIPVARVWHAFGGGSGGASDQVKSDGGGGGGWMRAVPVGVVEISPAGTRFIPFSQSKKQAAAIAIGVGIGFFLGGRYRRV